MTKENYLEIKDTLRRMRSEIRLRKQEIKEKQKIFSKFEKENGTFDYLLNRFETFKEAYEDSMLKEYWKVYPGGIQSSLYETKKNYRALHILYSLERGKSMDDIEKPKNEWWKTSAYFRLADLVKEYGFDKYDSLPSKTLERLGRVEYNGQIRLFTRDEMKFNS